MQRYAMLLQSPESPVPLQVKTPRTRREMRWALQYMFAEGLPASLDFVIQ